MGPASPWQRVLKTSRDRFYTSTQRIREILVSFDEQDVHILFVKNEIKQFAEDPFLRNEAYTLRVQPGVSIGIHSNSTTYSTLGGLIQLRFGPGTGSWQAYGLTNFHCVCPPVQHLAFPQWVHSPVRPGDEMAGRILKVNHPSVSDLRRTLDNLGSVITKFEEDAEYRDVKRRIEETKVSAPGLSRS